MPVTQDEEVAVRAPARGTLTARPTQDESIAPTGAVKISRGTAADETHAHSRAGRMFKESTEKLLEKFEKEEQDARTPTPHEEGDSDEEEPEGDADGTGETDDGDTGVVGEPGDAGEGNEAAEGEGEEKGEGKSGDENAPDPVAEWQTKAQTLEQRNRELFDELETARKTPKVQRTERETALMSAEAAYIDEGSIPALRKYLSVVTGTAHDSKEVDAELRGLFADLTALELGVPLDQNQQALRDNARTRLLLARDRREKAEAEKKPDVDNSADTAQYENAGKFVDNLLATRGQSGTSLADEHPLLMTLAEDFDGYTPGEVLARAIRQEIMTGTLDPKTSDIDMLRIVAPKIEKHYDAVAKKIEAARAEKNKKPDITTPSGKPKVAVEASKEQRQSHGARTLTNVTASRAPATAPKMTKQKAKTTVEKTRKDFPSEAAWRDHLLDKHFQS